TAAAIRTALAAQLARLERVPAADLMSARYERFRAFGATDEPGTAASPPPPPDSWYRRLLKRMTS
ncbi:MAG TPA: hypothetical protein VIS26_02685, partial [Candidatus Limnocylindria bacterium]